MDRRFFLKAAGGLGALGSSGAAGWALRGTPGAATRARAVEQGDMAGLHTGHSGAFGIHRVIYSVPMSLPYVGLTFDDGPDPQFTPRVLEILKGYGITATFNVMGYNALHHTDIFQELVKAGHEIGNHTWTHLDLSTVGVTDTLYEIRRGREVIEDLSGQKVRFFRPPRGEMSGLAMRTIAEEGNDLLMWSITGSVGHGDVTQAVESFVLSKIEPGSIIDYHDGIGRGTFHRSGAGAKALIARRTAEIESLPKMIETAMHRGFTFMSVGQLLTHEVPGQLPTGTLDTAKDPDQGEPSGTNPPDASVPKAAKDTVGPRSP